MVENNVILQVQDVIMQFGGLWVIDNVSFYVDEVEIFGFIGFNGVGKIILFNVIIVNYKFISGSVILVGMLLKGLKFNQVVNVGIVCIFQNICLFNFMMVLENVMVGFDCVSCYLLLEVVLYIGCYFLVEWVVKVKVMVILEDIGIVYFVYMQVINLSYGNQCKVEIVCVLVIVLKLFLFDELVVGMNLKEIEDLVELIFCMCYDYQFSVLLIEYDMFFVNCLCEWVMVLEYGKLLFSGLMVEVIQYLDVIFVYLGEVNYV